MAAFRFKLQSVLDLRQQKERESAVDLAKARTEADDARRAKEDLEAIRDAGRARLAQAHGAGGVVGHLQNLAYVVDQVDDQIERAADECRKADEHVAESLKEFHEAFKKRRSIDQLKTRLLDQWRWEENRTEQKSMDEVAATRHGRSDNTLSGGA